MNPKQPWPRFAPSMAAVAALLVGLSLFGATPRTPATVHAQTPAGTPAAAGEDDLPPVTFTEESSGGSPNNRIDVKNRTDNRLRVRAKIQLNHIPGDSVSPVNIAEAYSSCTGCKTFAIAVQLDLRSENATVVAPENVAVPVNYRCTGCETLAYACQVVLPVDDPSQVPPNIRDLVHQLNQQLQQLGQDKSVEDGDQVKSGLDGIVNTFDGAVHQFDSQVPAQVCDFESAMDSTTPGASPSP